MLAMSDMHGTVSIAQIIKILAWKHNIYVRDQDYLPGTLVAILYEALSVCLLKYSIVTLFLNVSGIDTSRNKLCSPEAGNILKTCIIWDFPGGFDRFILVLHAPYCRLRIFSLANIIDGFLFISTCVSCVLNLSLLADKKLQSWWTYEFLQGE